MKDLNQQSRKLSIETVTSSPTEVIHSEPFSIQTDTPKREDLIQQITTDIF